MENIRETWDKEKGRLLDAAGIDATRVPRYFPMEQLDNESHNGYIGSGAVAGGLTGILVSAAATASDSNRFKFHPVLYGGVGAAVGSLKNTFSYKGDNDGGKRKKTDKAKKLVSKKSNKR